MKVTLLQQDLAWADPLENQRRSELQLLSAPDSDLYVLPEMWSTGFAVDPTGVAEEGDPCASLLWMKMMAQRMDAAIAGSLAIRDADGTFRNRFYFVRPDGDVACYDKAHPFTYGGEHLRYMPGHERVVVEWRGVRFLLQVCYDLRFPCFSRNRAEGDGAYDAILYVASWPTSRIEAWNTLLRARAIENQCYVFGVGRVGQDKACRYSGGTQCVDPYGRVAGACPDNEVALLTQTMDMAALTAFRQKFPVLQDADRITLQ